MEHKGAKFRQLLRDEDYVFTVVKRIKNQIILVDVVDRAKPVEAD